MSEEPTVEQTEYGWLAFNDDLRIVAGGTTRAEALASYQESIRLRAARDADGEDRMSERTYTQAQHDESERQLRDCYDRLATAEQEQPRSQEAAPMDCDFNVHDDPRWCDTHNAAWPDPTRPCEQPRNQEAALPERIVVGANGAYWRDFGTHYSMPPVSEDNDPVEPVAVYVPAALLEDARRRLGDCDEALLDYERHPEQPRSQEAALREQVAALEEALQRERQTGRVIAESLNAMTEQGSQEAANARNMPEYIYDCPKCFYPTPHHHAPPRSRKTDEEWRGFLISHTPATFTDAITTSAGTFVVDFSTTRVARATYAAIIDRFGIPC